MHLICILYIGRLGYRQLFIHLPLGALNSN